MDVKTLKILVCNLIVGEFEHYGKHTIRHCQSGFKSDISLLLPD